MKDRIVYIGSNIPDKTPAGVRVFANSLALRDYGYDVKIISKDTDFSTEHNSIEGIEAWHLPGPNSTKDWILSLVSVKKYIRIIDGIEGVKTIIAYDQPSVVFLRLRSYCKRKRIKLLCETTEWQKWDNLGHLHGVARLVRLLDIETCMHIAYKKGDGIIVTSNYFGNNFKDVIPTLVLPTLQLNRKEYKEIVSVNRVRKFVYAGGIGYGKDMLCNTVRAFEKLKDAAYVFHIYGLALESYLERFPMDKTIIEGINENKERIFFHGKVDHETILREVANSDFAVIIRENSHRNNAGFPTKFGESINCGTPVIVSDFSDVVYYTQKYGVGIVTDIDRIEEGLTVALEMEDISLEEMKKRCRGCDVFYYKGHIHELGEFVKELPMGGTAKITNN